jgi:hypothetical protein
MKLHELVPYLDAPLKRVIMQRLPAAGREVAIGVLGIRQSLVELVQPPGITLEIFLVLGVYSLQLSIQRVLEKERANEELAKSIQCPP